MKTNLIITNKNWGEVLSAEGLIECHTLLFQSNEDCLLEVSFFSGETQTKICNAEVRAKVPFVVQKDHVFFMNEGDSILARSSKEGTLICSFKGEGYSDPDPGLQDCGSKNVGSLWISSEGFPTSSYKSYFSLTPGVWASSGKLYVSLTTNTQTNIEVGDELYFRTINSWPWGNSDSLITNPNIYLVERVDVAYQSAVNAGEPCADNVCPINYGIPNPWCCADGLHCAVSAEECIAQGYGIETEEYTTILRLVCSSAGPTNVTGPTVSLHDYSGDESFPRTIKMTVTFVLNESAYETDPVAGFYLEYSSPECPGTYVSLFNSVFEEFSSGGNPKTYTLTSQPITLTDPVPGYCTVFNGGLNQAPYGGTVRAKVTHGPLVYFSNEAVLPLNPDPPNSSSASLPPQYVECFECGSGGVPVPGTRCGKYIMPVPPGVDPIPATVCEIYGMYFGLMACHFGCAGMSGG